jgi:DNA-binding response OmpR family regulator
VENKSLAKISILVVEDELLIRMAMVDALRTAGYDVTEADTGDRAYEMLLDHDVTMLVTDIKMPGNLDGLALAKRVRSEKPATKIVLVSANKYSDMASVADAVFFKPVSVAHMLNCVRELMS